MNELLEKIEMIYKRYENDDEGLERLKTYVMDDIQDMMNIYEEEKKEKQEIEEKIVEYISDFFYNNETKYYSCIARNKEKIIIKYDDSDFEVCNSDSIWHEIITDLNPKTYPKLSKFKHDIAKRALVQVLENDILSCIPESSTIQKTIDFLCPLFFKKREEVKYFLACMGDSFRKINQNIQYYVPEFSREFLTEINVYYNDYFGDELMKQFKFKYRGYEYKNSRIIKFKRNIRNISYWNSFVKNNFFNILIVGLHYSTRYEGSENYIEKQNIDLGNKILYLKDRTQDDIFNEFKKEFLKKSEKDNLTQEEMYFLWKIFCENKSMPLMIYKQDFMDKVGKISYNTTSDYLIGIRHFQSFWKETIQEDPDGEYEISEINELFTIWLNGNKENTVNEYQLLDIINHFFPEVKIRGKNLLNISCTLWNKNNDIDKYLLNNKEKLMDKNHNLLEIYKLYCGYAGINYTNIVSKKYFEKYMSQKVPKGYVKNNKVLKEYW